MYLSVQPVKRLHPKTTALHYIRLTAFFPGQPV